MKTPKQFELYEITAAHTDVVERMKRELGARCLPRRIPMKKHNLLSALTIAALAASRRCRGISKRFRMR